MIDDLFNIIPHKNKYIITEEEFVNYITNLKEENENKDNKILELQQELLNKKLNIKDIEYKEKMIYKSRCEKAVEYLPKIRKTSSYELDEKIDNLEYILNGDDENDN